VDVRDIGLRHADDSEIASHAQREHQCITQLPGKLAIVEPGRVRLRS